MKKRIVLGIDIGGSGIKAAPIDTKEGLMLEPRHRIETPQPASPTSIVPVIAKMVRYFRWDGIVGCGYPGVVLDGVAKTAANIDKSWIGTNVNKLFSKETGLPVFVVNDADSAGLAEMKFGAGKGVDGLVLLCTIGTGIGTVLFNNGELVPNTEFGHIEYKGMDAEKYVSDAVRKNEGLSWEEWALRFNEYLKTVEKLFYPNLIILGGGASKKGEKFMKYLSTDTPVVTAKLKNNAGLTGAALTGKQQYKMYSGRKKKKKK